MREKSPRVEHCGILLTFLIQTAFSNPVIILTCSLLFLFQLLLLFLVFRLCVKVIVAVFGELPLIGLVHQIWGAACEINAEFLDVDFHDAAVNCHAHLREEEEEEQYHTGATTEGNKTGRAKIFKLLIRSVRTGLCKWTHFKTLRHIHIFAGKIKIRKREIQIKCISKAQKRTKNISPSPSLQGVWPLCHWETWWEWIPGRRYLIWTAPQWPDLDTNHCQSDSTPKAGTQTIKDYV